MSVAEGHPTVQGRSLHPEAIKEHHRIIEELLNRAEHARSEGDHAKERSLRAAAAWVRLI